MQENQEGTTKQEDISNSNEKIKAFREKNKRVKEQVEFLENFSGKIGKDQIEKVVLRMPPNEDLKEMGEDEKYEKGLQEREDQLNKINEMFEDGYVVLSRENNSTERHITFDVVKLSEFEKQEFREKGVDLGKLSQVALNTFWDKRIEASQEGDEEKSYTADTKIDASRLWRVGSSFNLSEKRGTGSLSEYYSAGSLGIAVPIAPREKFKGEQGFSPEVDKSMTEMIQVCEDKYGEDCPFTRTHYLKDFGMFTGQSKLVENVDNSFELADALGSKKLDENKFFFIAKRMTEAIKMMQENNIVHNDLNLGNIFLNKDKDSLKIIDYGMTKELDEKNKNNDLQALGRILCSMLAGEEVKRRDNIEDIKSKIMKNNQLEGLNDKTLISIATKLHKNPEALKVNKNGSKVQASVDDILKIIQKLESKYKK